MNVGQDLGRLEHACPGEFERNPLTFQLDLCENELIRGPSKGDADLYTGEDLMKIVKEGAPFWRTPEAIQDVPKDQVCVTAR